MYSVDNPETQEIAGVISANVLIPCSISNIFKIFGFYKTADSLNCI